MEFTHYYGKHKNWNKTVAQPVVLQKTLRTRVSGERLEKFNKHKYYSGLDESKFLRLLIDEALDKREAEEWKKEIESW